MAKPLRPKRGTTAKNDAFTGLASEITIDTEKHSIRVHDNVTAGGHEILPKEQNDKRYPQTVNGIPVDENGNIDTLSIPYQVNVDLNTLTETGVYAVHARDLSGAVADNVYAQENLNFPVGLGVNCFIQVWTSDQKTNGGLLEDSTRLVIRQVAYRIGTTGSNDDAIYTRTGFCVDGYTVFEFGPWYCVPNGDFLFTNDTDTQKSLYLMDTGADADKVHSDNRYLSLVFTDKSRSTATAKRFGVVETHSNTAGDVHLYLRAYSQDRTTATLDVFAGNGGKKALRFDGKNFTIGESDVYGTYASVNLNTLISAGVYAVNGGSTDLNFPASGGGSNAIVVVYATENTQEWKVVKQLYYRLGTTGSNDHNLFWRSGVKEDANSDWVFTEWYKDVSLLDWWQSGTSWYRIDSNLWCEQGGIVTGTGTKTVTLHTPMRDTNYQVLVSYNNTNNSSNNVTPNEVSAFNKTTTSFQIYNDFDGKAWRVSGFVNRS